jgi:hypothetical protein
MIADEAALERLHIAHGLADFWLCSAPCPDSFAHGVRGRVWRSLVRYRNLHRKPILHRNLLSRGYGDARWMTYRQAQTRGYQVRRGEKGTQVQYWRFDEERKINDSSGRPVIDANGEPRTEKVRLERPQVFIGKCCKFVVEAKIYVRSSVF